MKNFGLFAFPTSLYTHTSLYICMHICSCIYDNLLAKMDGVDDYD